MSKETIKLLKHLGVSSLSGAAFVVGSAMAEALLEEVIAVLENYGQTEKTIKGFRPEDR